MKIQNVNALPIDSNNIGNSCETKKTEAHKAKIHIDMAFPLAWLGKISAITTKVKGPNDMPKKIM